MIRSRHIGMRGMPLRSAKPARRRIAAGEAIVCFNYQWFKYVRFTHAGTYRASVWLPVDAPNLVMTRNGVNLDPTDIQWIHNHRFRSGNVVHECEQCQMPIAPGSAIEYRVIDGATVGSWTDAPIYFPTTHRFLKRYCYSLSFESSETGLFSGWVVFDEQKRDIGSVVQLYETGVPNPGIGAGSNVYNGLSRTASIPLNVGNTVRIEFRWTDPVVGIRVWDADTDTWVVTADPTAFPATPSGLEVYDANPWRPFYQASGAWSSSFAPSGSPTSYSSKLTGWGGTDRPLYPQMTCSVDGGQIPAIREWFWAAGSTEVALNQISYLGNVLHGMSLLKPAGDPAHLFWKCLNPPTIEDTLIGTTFTFESTDTFGNPTSEPDTEVTFAWA